MSVKVSVIIPVYNAEKYLPECIESLQRQSLKECEFIFVNDGSRDRSREIIREYKNQDNRITLINQQNQGVSVARNKGLEMATGEYVGFVDADDFVEKEMYNTLYTAAKHGDCDAVISNFQSEMDGKKLGVDYPFPRNTLLGMDYIRNNILLYFIKYENLNSVCNKIFKNQLLKDNKIRFPEGVALGEDGMLNIQFFSKASKAIYLNYCGYSYREVSGSATRNFMDHDYFQRALEIYTMRLPEIFKQITNEKNLQELKSVKLINSVMGFIYNVTSTNVSFNEKYQYINRVVTNPHVREALLIYYKKTYQNLGRYDRTFIKMMKNKKVLGLYMVTCYSQLRNKNNGGILG